MWIKNILVTTPQTACYDDVKIDRGIDLSMLSETEGYRISSGTKKGFLPNRINLKNTLVLGTDILVITHQQDIGNKGEIVLQHLRTYRVGGGERMFRLLETIPLEVGTIPAPDTQKAVEMDTKFPVNVEYANFSCTVDVFVDFPVESMWVYPDDGVGIRTTKFLVDTPGSGFRLALPPESCRFVLTVEDRGDGPKVVLQQHGPLAQGGPDGLLYEYDVSVVFTEEAQKLNQSSYSGAKTPSYLSVFPSKVIGERDLHSEMRQPSNIHIGDDYTYQSFPVETGLESVLIIDQNGELIAHGLLPIDRYCTSCHYHLYYQGRGHLVLGTSQGEKGSQELSPHVLTMVSATPTSDVPTPYDFSSGEELPAFSPTTTWIDQPVKAADALGLTWEVFPAGVSSEYIVVSYKDGGFVGDVVVPIGKHPTSPHYHLRYPGLGCLELRAVDGEGEILCEYTVTNTLKRRIILVQRRTECGDVFEEELVVGWSSDGVTVDDVSHLENGGTVLSITYTTKSGETLNSSAVLPLLSSPADDYRLFIYPERKELVLMDKRAPYSKDRQVFNLVSVS